MVIEDGKFYFIKDEFFDVFKNYGLMENKDNGTKRPCYFCFKDKKFKDIIWFVPISTIIKMWTATLFAKYKFIGEKMWTATLLARYKYAGEKMIVIVKYGVYKIDPIFS